MRLIYAPTGRALEYSPFALNIYTGGCEHGCAYCYCANGRAWGTAPRVRNLAGLEADAAMVSRQVLLSFMSDPYGPIEEVVGNTRRALGILSAARCSVAILTKGGLRCTRDIEIFRAWPDSRIQVGATLTFADHRKSLTWEPGAASPESRIRMLAQLHQAGVRTFASIEPVIEAQESLDIIAWSLLYVDGYKIGRLNHQWSNVDWLAFGTTAVEMIRRAGKLLYVKNDLRAAMAGFAFRPEETNPETTCLADRPPTVKIMLPPPAN